MKELGLVILTLMLASCSATKRVVLEPVELNAATYKPQVYQPAYTLLTDIIHTKLDISFNWDSAFVFGKAYIEAKPYFYSSREVVLNANGFKISQVSLVNTAREGLEKFPLKYVYDGKLLRIDLGKVYTGAEKFTLFVEYVAMPEKLLAGKDISSPGDRGLYFINRTGKDKDVPRQVWSQGEMESNSTWFPTINNPQEKMTQDISITVPNEMVTLSNGELDFSSSNSNGTRTDNWRMEKPHSTYLTMIAAGNFAIIKDKWRTKEVSYYMEPAYAEHAKLIFGKTPEMIEFFSKKTGVDYPWDKYSQIVVRDFVSGAMENTSASVFFDKLNMDAGQYQDENYEDIISHELFHQWFGNLVTCESWSHLALNESFANYGEYLWDEYKYGRDYADYRGLKDMQMFLTDPFNKGESLIRYSYSDKNDLFDNVTYEKGGRILHMLRKTVGDDAFFKSLNLYLNRHAYKNTEVNDLREVFEEISGQDLNWFFNQWFLAPGNPKLFIQSSFDPLLKQVSINLQQMQDLAEMPLYRIPLLVDIYRDGKTERKEIVFEKQNQTFIFPSETEPDLVNVDAEKALLAEKSENKTLKQFVFQYDNAPLFLDRFEAVNMFISYKKEKSARQKMVKALTDKNWYIRKLAVDFVLELDKLEQDEVYTSIRKLAVADERSYVRAAAITILNKVYKTADNSDIFEKASADKAPSVIKALGGW